MNSCSCGKPLQEQISDYDMKSLLVGTITVPRVRSSLCASCGNRYVDYAQAKGLELYVNHDEVAAVARLPDQEFVSRAEALKILGMTEREFTENPKIRNNFVIIRRTPGRPRRYLRESLKRFRETGDGRFNVNDYLKSL